MLQVVLAGRMDSVRVVEVARMVGVQEGRVGREVAMVERGATA